MTDIVFQRAPWWAHLAPWAMSNRGKSRKRAHLGQQAKRVAHARWLRKFNRGRRA